MSQKNLEYSAEPEIRRIVRWEPAMRCNVEWRTLLANKNENVRKLS